MRWTPHLTIKKYLRPNQKYAQNGSDGFDKIDHSFKVNKEILLLAYEQDNSGWNSYASKENYVPEEFINDVEIVSAAVKAGWSLDKVTDDLKNDKDKVLALSLKDVEKIIEEKKKNWLQLTLKV